MAHSALYRGQGIKSGFTLVSHKLQQLQSRDTIPQNGSNDRVGANQKTYWTHLNCTHNAIFYNKMEIRKRKG